MVSNFFCSKFYYTILLSKLQDFFVFYTLFTYFPLRFGQFIQVVNLLCKKPSDYLTLSGIM